MAVRRTQPAVRPNQQNIINHVGFVLDRSGSMRPHAANLIKAIDAQVAHLAARSKELDQETRVSVWSFGSTVQCLVWDMDVLRLPSIATLYKVDGNTALIDASMMAIRDLSETPQRYGDHSFLVYVATDGQENWSSAHTASQLTDTINGLDDNWTMAALVPNANGKHEAKRFGFPAGNIEVWDTSSTRGVEEAVRRIQVVTDHYMTARATGTRSTKTLFSMDSATVNKKTVKATGLKPLTKDQFTLTVVVKDCPIKAFVQEEMGKTWVIGRGYYQLTKREDIQPQKNVALVEKSTNKVYIGQAARDLLGLPDMTVRVSPDHNPDYMVFVQSTSTNRKLIAGQKFLYMEFTS